MDWRPPSSPGELTGCYRAIIHLVVDERGLPIAETARLVRTTDTQFARAAMDAIISMRFRPALRNGVAVKQVYEHDAAALVAVSVGGGRPSPPSRIPC
jgi:hypothetical protein